MSFLFQLLSSSILFYTALCQINTANDQIAIKFSKKQVTCTLSPSVDSLYNQKDCTIILQINNKIKYHVKNTQLFYKYKKPLMVKIQCTAMCANDFYKNNNMRSETLTINTEIFIGLCVAGGVIIIIIIALLIWWCKWGRRFNCRACAYYKELEVGDRLETTEAEVPPIPHKEPPRQLQHSPKSVSSDSANEEDMGNPYKYKEMTSEI